MDIIEQVKDRLAIFNNFYDIIRIVDPIKNITIFFDRNKDKEIEKTCYDFWEKEVTCDNCISRKAYINNDTYVKIEYNDEKMYLMTSTPMELEGKVYILEILKDITANGIIVDKNNHSEDVKSLIAAINNKIIKDELTGIYNRRYINETLPSDVKKSFEEEYPLSIIMADIDFFKNVNDTYGHLIGDKILQDFAQLISTVIRKNVDWLGRYGGEEFLIILKNSDSSNAYIVAEKIRKLTSEKIFSHENNDIHITASFGVYEIKEKNMGLDDILSHVDKNLYAAKVGGRNKTIVST